MNNTPTRLTHNCAHLRSTNESLTVEGDTGWYLVILGQYGEVLVGTLWYWVSIERYWLINNGTLSVEGSTGWYSMVMGQ